MKLRLKIFCKLLKSKQPSRIMNAKKLFFYFPGLRRFYGINSYLIQDFRSLLGIITGRKYKLKNPNFTIISSTFCNANCVFCANRHLKDKRGIMSFPLFKKIIDDLIKNFSIDDIGLTPTIGEILLDPLFFQKLKYLSDNNIKINLITNGVLLDQNIEKFLEIKIKSLLIDVGDINPKFDSRVFGITESISKKRLESIIKLIEKNQDKKTIEKIIVGFRPQRKPCQIIKEMKKTILWEYYKKNLFDMDFHMAYDNWGGTIKEENLLGFQKLKKAPNVKKYPCQNLSSFSFLPNGDIRLCACRIKNTFLDELYLGNIKNNPIKKLMQSEKRLKVIKGFQQGKIPEVCKKCTFYRPSI